MVYPALRIIDDDVISTCAAAQALAAGCSSQLASYLEV
jgi:hypothetical protein